jgi:hypothetical protein
MKSLLWVLTFCAVSILCHNEDASAWQDWEDTGLGTRRGIEVAGGQGKEDTDLDLLERATANDKKEEKNPDPIKEVTSDGKEDSDPSDPIEGGMTPGKEDADFDMGRPRWSESDDRRSPTVGDESQ